MSYLYSSWKISNSLGGYFFWCARYIEHAGILKNVTTHAITAYVLGWPAREIPKWRLQWDNVMLDWSFARLKSSTLLSPSNYSSIMQMNYDIPLHICEDGKWSLLFTVPMLQLPSSAIQQSQDSANNTTSSSTQKPHRIKQIKVQT